MLQCKREIEVSAFKKEMAGGCAVVECVDVNDFTVCLCEWNCLSYFKLSRTFFSIVHP